MVVHVVLVVGGIIDHDTILGNPGQPDLGCIDPHALQILDGAAAFVHAGGDGAQGQIEFPFRLILRITVEQPCKNPCQDEHARHTHHEQGQKNLAFHA